VTHDQEEALSMADTVVIMNGGRVEQAGPPAEVFHRAASAFVAEFLGNSNVLAGRVPAAGVLEVAGQLVTGVRLPAASGPVTVVIRSGDMALRPPGTLPDQGEIALDGTVEDALFHGSLYRHTVTVGGETVLVDAPSAHHRGPVWVAAPVEKVLVFPAGNGNE